MGKAKEAMNGTLIGIVIRTFLLFFCSSLKIGIWGLIIATSANIIVVTLHQVKQIKKAFQLS